jgi:hypothetical protein
MKSGKAGRERGIGKFRSTGGELGDDLQPLWIAMCDVWWYVFVCEFVCECVREVRLVERKRRATPIDSRTGSYRNPGLEVLNRIGDARSTLDDDETPPRAIASEERLAFSQSEMRH